MRPVVARRSLRVAIAALIALGLQSAYAVPLAAVAELRARACCAGSCHRTEGVVCPRGCCQLKRGGADTATLSSATGLQLPVVHFSVPPTPVSVSLRSPVPDGQPPVSRAGPIFLLVRSLRL